jgi:hypothetical protein
MARLKNVALRGSTVLAVRAVGVETCGQAEKHLLSVVKMP